MEPTKKNLPTNLETGRNEIEIEQKPVQRATAQDALGSILAPASAVGKILAPELTGLWAESTSELRMCIPSDPAEAAALYARLPIVEWLVSTRNRLEARLANKATAGEVAEVVAALLTMKPNLKEAHGGYLASLTLALTFEADEKRWPSCVIAAGLHRAICASSYMPELAEIITHTEKAARDFRRAVRMVDRTCEAIWALEDMLQAAGYPIEDDGREEF